MVDTIDPYTGRERGPSPGLTALRSIATAMSRMRMRSGQAQNQALIWTAVIVGIIILGGTGYGIYRLITSGSEDQALKNNIDRVAEASETYWQQFAPDRHGRRDIDIMEFCNYANSEFGVGDELALRTLAVADGADATAPDAAETHQTLGLVTHVSAFDAAVATNTEATCPSAVDLFGSFDIIVNNAAIAANTTAANDAFGIKEASDAAESDDLISAGLMSTSTVWIAQHAGWDQSTTPAIDEEVPAGTRTTGNTAANDVLVFGGVSPSGRSFCLIKVFSASDRGQVGEYRVARDASDSNVTPISVCSLGANGSGANEPRINSGWPEAR